MAVRFDLRLSLLIGGFCDVIQGWIVPALTEVSIMLSVVKDEFYCSPISVASPS